MTVSLVTLGDPDIMTGGYLYHRRLADMAPEHDAVFASSGSHNVSSPYRRSPAVPSRVWRVRG
jgi:hypothetical protein